MEQLSLLPDKPLLPDSCQVMTSDISYDLPGEEPSKAFISSIENFGILQPVGLIERSFDNYEYRVVFGRRRIKAARIVGLTSVPANIYPSDSALEEILSLVENLQRKDNLVVKLQAIESLRLKATEKEFCIATGLTKAKLKSALKLIDGLVPELRQALAEGRIGATVAQKAVKLSNDQQRILAEFEKIKAKDVISIRESTTAIVEGQPVLFSEEIEKANWQVKANKPIDQLLKILPQEANVAFTKVQQLREVLGSC